MRANIVGEKILSQGLGPTCSSYIFSHLTFLEFSENKAIRVAQRLNIPPFTEWRDQKISSSPVPRLYFETKVFETDIETFFSRPNVFETDTETFFWDQMFSRLIPILFLRPNFLRLIPRLFFRPDFCIACDWLFVRDSDLKHHNEHSSGQKLSPSTDYSWRINESWVLLLHSLLRGQIHHIYIQRKQLQKLESKIKGAFSWFF